jgi:hypothetical protein
MFLIGKRDGWSFQWDFDDVVGNCCRLMKVVREL